ncbi:DNA mismatch repair protein MutT [Spongiactinospora rosea]|uniref:8-oxo-dGTP diphosphatase n=1 Tax=Spongiactinospora rosea TaxID=2248750 RepID=A0A366LX80_9ACTN|nr:(deoxy)nucleoside triphosphate pyrophosphohydrolase [Spongiactinospora rosea]RBQ18576.1 DNA mismatch repair protein MutT [Spongiactinospora rosea]
MAEQAEQIVVGAAIVAGGRLLAAQRAEPPALYGGWEFPGGKVNPGESEVAALIRECDEELGVLIKVGARVGGDWALADGYLLRVWLAEVVAGVPEPKEHLELRWLARSDLYTVPWLPADLPIVHAVEKLLDEG